ncbi:MAG: hypothetical protein B5M48_01125 [Candidatus Omnitrophica bacterium 4484_213]|nr:MAG: hypothetical protein B5M48_01125 [Candidatus Omnitrophica bacterium 4484_213]
MYDEAIESYKNALKISPQLAGAYGGIGIAYEKKAFMMRQ